MIQATPIQGRLSSQCQSSASAIKYYVAHPTYGPGSYTAETFKIYYTCHTFHQAVKATDESGTTLQQFWKDSNTYKSIKTLSLLGVKLWPSPRNGAWNNLCLQLSHNFRGLEKGGEGFEEVFSNWVTLSKKVGLDLLEGNSTELLAGQQEDLLMKTWRNWRLGERMEKDKRKK